MKLCLITIRASKWIRLRAMFGKSEFGSDKYDDLLLNDRNKKWVIKLDSIMHKESVFVAVGAGHLVGDKGLISLLRKQGYTVSLWKISKKFKDNSVEAFIYFCLCHRLPSEWEKGCF